MTRQSGNACALAVPFLVLLVVLVSAPARAQERGRVGVAMGLPGSVALVWHPSQDVALRPDFTFRRLSSDVVIAAGGQQILPTSLDWTFGLSGLIYTGKWDELQAYVSPRVGYGRVTNSTSSYSSWTVTTSGSFGGQYRLGQRFAAYGEAGLVYITSRTSGTLSSPAQQIWTTRSTAGVIFYVR